MRGKIEITVVDDNSLVIQIVQSNRAFKTITCAPKDYEGLTEAIIKQMKLFQKQPVVDITKD